MAGGDPQKGWALVLALRDLSMVMPDSVQVATSNMVSTWQTEADVLGTEDSGIKQINDATYNLRKENLLALESLH